MESEQEPKQRRKRKKLLQDIYIEESNDEIIERLIDIMKEHIGSENAITLEKLFFMLFNRHLTEFEFYKGYYYVEKLRYLIQTARKKQEIQIVLSGSKAFVLKTEAEFKVQEKNILSVIDGYKSKLQHMKEWVEKQKWRELK